MQEERASLSRFDNELADLERVIKAKKEAASEADLNVQKLEHAQQALTKEKETAAKFVTNLEKQYDWLAEESQ